MQYADIPRLNKRVARIVQGSTMIGSDLDERESFALLDQVYELGCNTLDTAHGYSRGESERIIGRWMQARNLREEIVIITKGAAHSEDRRRMTPFDIASDLHDSLARLPRCAPAPSRPLTLQRRAYRAAVGADAPQN